MGEATAFARVLEELRVHWRELAPTITVASREQIRALVGRINAEPPGHADWDARNTLSTLLLHILREPHPVRRAALTSQRRSNAVEDVTTMSDLLFAEITAYSFGEADPQAEEVRYWAEKRLLAAPSLGEDELRTIGLDPDDGELIQLEGHDGSSRWPEFQFSSDGSPIAVVLAVNRLLESDDDPWGAADWWLCPNAWLGDVPARLISRDSDDRLLSAARAVDPGV